jgi:malate dehydrogenase (oxaloacetate-decarboxylating)(NADP+)
VDDGYNRIILTDIGCSTGSVILAGFLAAAKQASEASGRDLKDHKIVFLGGGSAAVG